MKPRLLTILLLLLAGAVVNVGVAWGCAAWIGTSYSDEKLTTTWIGTSYSDERLTTTKREGQPSELVYTERSVGHTRVNLMTSGPRDVVYRAKESVDLCGWPLRSLACSRLEHARVAVDGDMIILGSRRGAIRDGIRLTPDANGWRALPYRPLFSGFALNTLFYAALLWLLFCFAPTTLRRHLRARRGLCPACGYPVGESAVCSECGKAVRQTNRISGDPEVPTTV